MKKLQKLVILTMVVAFAALAVVGPVTAADSQKNKNMWRNLAIGAGVVAGHGLLRHNTTETVIGAAGAAYSANRYEQARRSQSKASAAAKARYHRHNYRTSTRKYYTYNGHQYYMNRSTGARVRIN